MEEFCSFCGENDSSVICTKCNFSVCSECINGGICQGCRADLCGICNYEYYDFKDCEKCGKVCCIGCQTGYGICKECLHAKNLIGSS